MIHVWARILKALPTARLLLKNKPFACESARAHTLGLLAVEVRSRISVSRHLLPPWEEQTIQPLNKARGTS